MKLPFKLTFWRVLLAIVWTAGAYAVFIRFTEGLGASSNLSDKFPWGLWIGFDVVTGVGLAAGGFTIAAAVYVLHLKKFYPVLRPAILTAFLGYAIVIVGLLIDIGHPLRIYHPLLMGNFTSVMFEVAMCVMFYTTVLGLEFSTVIFERFGWKKPKKWVGKVIVPLVIIGVILSFLHQSSLGSLYLIMPSKLYPFWYSPLLPVFFLISAISTGCAMVILESHLSFNAFGHKLDHSILKHLGRVILIGLILYVVLKVQDFTTRGVWDLVFVPRMETYLLWLELIIGSMIPIILLSIKKVRLSSRGLYICAIFTISGFLFNRMNVSITGIEGSAGATYIPSWMEVAISLSLVGVAVFLFAMAVRYFPVFGKPLIETKKQKIGSVKADNVSPDLSFASKK